MSGSIDQLIAGIGSHGIDPYPTEGEIADVQTKAAQSSLLQQQTQAAQIQNYLAGLRASVIGQSLGIPPPPGVPVPGSMGNTQGGAQGAMQGAPGGGAAPVSPYGAVMSPLGVPVPALMAATAITSNDPGKAWSDAIQTRARTLSQLIAPTSDVPGWNRAVQTAYASGYMTPDDYAQMYNHPEHKQSLLNSFADPNQHIETLRDLAGRGMAIDPGTGYPAPYGPAIAGAAQMKGAETSAEQAIKFPYDVARTRAEPRAVAPNEALYYPNVQTPGTGTGRPLSGIADPNASMSPDEWTARTMGVESGGNPNAQNPRSSAAGAMQIIDPTWLRVARSSRPDLTQGKTDAQVLAMRSDPAISQEIGANYASGEVAPALTAAGIHANAATTHMGYFLGPDGAIKALQAPENTPMSKVVSQQVLDANPQLKNMTNSQLYAQEVSKFGVGQVAGITSTPMAPVTTATPPGVATPAGQPDILAGMGAGSAPQGPGLSVAQGPGGTTVSNTLTPGAIEAQKNAANWQNEYQKDWGTQAQSAYQQNALLERMIPDTATWTMGRFADAKGNVLSLLDSMRQNVNSLAGKEVFPPIQGVGDWQAANKTIAEFVRQKVVQTSPRAAAIEFPFIQKAVFNDETSPQGFRQIAAQMMGINDWTQAKSAASAQMGRSNNVGMKPNEFENAFDTQVPVGVYILNRLSQADAKAWHDSLAKTEGGQQYWNDLVSRTKILHNAGMVPNVISMDAFTQPGGMGGPAPAPR